MTKTIEVSDEVFEKIKDHLGDGKEIHNYQDLVGEKLLLRGVTMYQVGEVKKVVGRFVQLKNASWVADTGKFSECIKNGDFNEVEYVGDAFVNMDTVVDFFPWKHPLPTKTK